ncbi:DUF4298 domain-containing protein [Olsenella massiliensis]|uniref:DUF4298 domain-containing protein n=1 Tax=Olsenella massiliensis TaxID=1622075 RepID=UPI000AB18834|nr:DUF4298 domain-containing protein [Olsenella massiliensis]
MDTAERIDRITKMESILNSHAAAAAGLAAALDEFERSQKSYPLLRDYYVEGGYMQDVAADNEGLLPDDLPRGVLSEDAVFDLMGENVELAIRMLELATVVIRDR